MNIFKLSVLYALRNCSKDFGALLGIQMWSAAVQWRNWRIWNTLVWTTLAQLKHTFLIGPSPKLYDISNHATYVANSFLRAFLPIKVLQRASNWRKITKHRERLMHIPQPRWGTSAIDRLIWPPFAKF